MKWFALILILLSPLAPSAVHADKAATQALNAFRADNGVKRIKYNRKLERAAKAHAQDMIDKDFFSHTGSNGSDVGQRIRKAGFRWCYAAENIAKGQRSLEAVMQGWANSPGHRRNMLSKKARHFGLYRGEGNTWVMVLARKC